MSTGVVESIRRFMREGRGCGRHADNAMPCAFVLAPVPLCGDCVSLGWYWRWDAGAGWVIDREVEA